ncbi:MAG: ATP-binding protein [Acholeplasmatales bacterium]|nr:ATP-binding protein [Acholeplasmatales bacterium]
MAFDYAMKYRTYDAALKNAKELLEKNDVENGLFYLDKAIALSKELSIKTEIFELKTRFSKEHKKLVEIRENIVKNKINPFRKVVETKSGPNENVNEKEDNEPKFFKTEPPSVTLKDVAGLEEVKKEIKLNVILPMKNPDFYFKYKDEVGCQILMYGPPGCGKSFVAEAIAGELKCSYAIVNTFDILDKYVGEAPKKIKQLFEEAKQYDNCLIFFDELDALFASRDSSDSEHTKDVLTAVLSCMSGFNAKGNKKNVRVIIGATNRPWALDSALVRGKRFDTHLYVTLPDHDARLFLINKAFKNRQHLLENTDVTVEDLTQKFDGYSCADISAMIDKITSKAMAEGLLELEKGEDGNVPICMKFVDEVMANYRNSVTKESLLNYEAFKKGEF